MSQTSLSLAAECKCGHSWTLQKPPDEMADGPRCSECGASSGDISVMGGQEQSEPVESDTTEPDIVWTAKRDRRLYELRVRVRTLIESLDGTAPKDSVHEVAREVQGVYRELRSILEGLREDSESDDQTLEALDKVSHRVDELADEIDEYTEEIETVDTLSDAVEELQEEREQLREKVACLRSEQEEVESELEEKRVFLEIAEDVEQAYETGRSRGRRKGYAEARDEFEIRVACANCGQPMTVDPRSDMHDRIAELLQQEKWRHGRCDYS